MSGNLTVHPDVIAAARAVALAGGYREVVRVLDRRAAGGLALAPAEAAHLAKFARLLKLQAELRYPHWDEDLAGYSPADEDLFQDVNLGLYEKLASALLAAFPDAWAASGPVG